jgi:RNA polymerase sigma-70 factor (ECF subfamily)
MLAIEFREWDRDITVQEMYTTAERVVRSFNLSSQQADDALQESVIRALQKAHTLKENSNTKPWLKTLTRNVCLSMIRHSKESKQVMIDDNPDYESKSYSVQLEAPCFFSSYEKESKVIFLKNTIFNMPDSDRKNIAVGHYIEGKTVRELSEELSIKSNTILSHLRRLRQTLSLDFEAAFETSFVLAH